VLIDHHKGMFALGTHHLGEVEKCIELFLVQLGYALQMDNDMARLQGRILQELVGCIQVDFLRIELYGSNEVFFVNVHTKSV
jgi:hypothetical protein